jgi:hypothetical protein
VKEHHEARPESIERVGHQLGGGTPFGVVSIGDVSLGCIRE